MFICLRLQEFLKGLDKIDINYISQEVIKNLIDGFKIKDLQSMTKSISVDLISDHYNYSYFSARLILDDLYKKILSFGLHTEGLDQAYKINFKQYIHIGIQENLITERLQNEFDLEKIINAITPERDLLFMFLGLKTIEDRYLLKTRSNEEKEGEIFELPQYMWMRVAMGLALNEKDKEEKAIEFYNVLSNMYLVSSTPTLFNCGTLHMQLSSCYINTVGDSLDEIFKNYADNAQLSKWAGGIGTDWTQVRSLGANIKGTNGKSSGIIPFIKIFNDVAVAVNQGGKRKGAMASYLEVWHLDIEEYIELRKNTGDDRRRAHDIHPAVYISDLFMKRVLADEMWTLFSPDDAPELHNAYGRQFEDFYIEYEKSNMKNTKKIKAKDLWRKILTMLYETGHPWITFKDAINVRSPQDHVGTVHSSNLCTEITLNTSVTETAVCNLASINLAKMVKNGKLNEKLISSTIETGVRMLDNVIDINFYPTSEAKNSNLKHRPVGLGMMGYHDALFQLDVTYCSEKQLEFADRSMEMISYYAILSSSKLAKEKGSYSTYSGSKWSKGILPFDTIELLEKDRGREIDVNRSMTMNWETVRKHINKHGMRNSNCMAIAPTATIANIAGVIPCVEPIYKNIYSKNNLSGKFLIINRYLIDRLEALNLWNKKILNELKMNDGSVVGINSIPENIQKEFREVYEIDQKWIVNAAANRSKWIDQSASTNIFIETVSGKYLSDLYTSIWEKGLKTTYYLRTKAASQVEKTLKTSMILEQRGNSQNNTSDQSCSLDNADCESCQ